MRVLDLHLGGVNDGVPNRYRVDPQLEGLDAVHVEPDGDEGAACFEDGLDVIRHLENKPPGLGKEVDAFGVWM